MLQRPRIGARARLRPSTAALILLALIGCGGDDGMGARHPVSGRVTYRGEPVPRGTVTFVPEDAKAGRVASGELGEDGTFRATTVDRDDGALAGRYRVTVVAIDVDRSKVKKVGLGMPRHDQLGKAPRKDLAPRKYGNPATSGLAAEVKPGSNRFEFRLED